MNKLFTLTLIGLVIAMTGASASASILDSFRGITLIEDNDAEGLIGGDGDEFVEVGDFIVAFAEFPIITALSDPPGTTFDEDTPMIVSISLIEVISASPPGGTTASFEFAPASAADWSSLLGLTVSGDDTALLVYQDPVSAPDAHIDTSSIAAALASTDGELGAELLYEFGDGGADFFWEADTTSVTDATDILAIDSLRFFAALDLLVHYAGPPLLPHNFLGTPSLDNPLGPGDRARYTGPTELQLFGVRAASPLGTSAELPLPTDTDAYVLIVPEPMSVSVWCGITFVAFGVGTLRSRKSA